MRRMNDLSLSVRHALINALGLMIALAISGCGAGSSPSSGGLLYLLVTPGHSAVPMGHTVQFRVTASYSNGTSVDVTNSVAWSAADPAVAAVSSGGLVTPKAPGGTSIFASMLGIKGSASVDVGKAALTAIAIKAPSSPLPAGTTAQLQATGTYTDQSVVDVTNSVAWTAAQPDVLAVSATGLIAAKAAGTTHINASLDDVNASAAVSVSPAALTAIGVLSKRPALPVGSTEQLTAMGAFTDGSTADLTAKVAWSSSSPASIDVSGAGLAAAKAVGAATVTATLAGITGSASLTASGAALTSIAVSTTKASLPVGGTAQVSATGTYTDGSTRDITASAQWSSTSPGVIAVSNTGQILAKSVGTAGVSAALSDVTGNATITATPAELVSLTLSSSGPTLPVGASLQLSATGVFTDGSSQDLTSSATWASSSPEVATVNSPGVISGLALGSAVISATSGAISATNEITVSDPALSSLSVTPSAPVVALGSSLQLAVTGILSDGSTQDVTAQVAWSVDTPTIAAVSDAGVVTGLQIGSALIHASLKGLDATAALTVLPALGVSYYDTRSSTDSTIRITNPAITGRDLCAMIYVFDQDQQMGECCGCLVSQNGLLTLSLQKNLLNNPLTGVPSTAGTVMLVSAQPAASGGCDASSISPAGLVIGWSTQLPASQSQLATTVEHTFSVSPLASTDAASLQAQCSFIQQLGSGQGICGCGGAQY